MSGFIRFFHIGDLHVCSQALDIAPLLEACVSARPAPDFLMTGGDNVDGGGHAEYASFLQSIAALKTPIFMVRGNHDRGHFARHLG
ncbi:MAG: metallophosphoesterase, partial [Verrucomicrobia bacterium]|nr:metallophosphoesterase [Verrucomicrobiota bacterium]